MISKEFEVVASISNPSERTKKIDMNNLDFNEIVKILKDNKISFLFLKKGRYGECYHDFFASPQFLNAYKEEFDKYISWRKDFLKIKKRWDKESIEYIFFKSTECFLPHMSDNLDVLVRERDFESAASLLKEMRYIELKKQEEPSKILFRKFVGGKSLVPIHLHKQVTWGAPYINNIHLWKNFKKSEEDKIVFFPCPEDQILITIAHCFIENHKIKLSDILTVSTCINNFDIDWEYILKSAKQMYWLRSLYTSISIFEYFNNKLYNQSLFPKEILDYVKKYIKQRKWIYRTLNNKIYSKKLAMPLNIPLIFVRIHGFLRILQDPYFGPIFQRIGIIGSQIFEGLWRRHLGADWSKQPSMLISLSGIDGTGKSRHARALVNIFKECELDVCYEWSRATHSRLFIFMLKAINLLLPMWDRSIVASNNHLSHAHVKKRLWLFINIIDIGIRYFRKYRFPLFSNKVVICDRYIYDSMVDLMEATGITNLESAFYKILLTMNPKPEISFLLDTDVKTALDRKDDEYHLSALERRKELYKKLENIINFRKVDSSLSFAKVSENIAFNVLTTYMETYPKKYDGYKRISYKYG